MSQSLREAAQRLCAAVAEVIAERCYNEELRARCERLEAWREWDEICTDDGQQEEADSLYTDARRLTADALRGK